MRTPFLLKFWALCLCLSFLSCDNASNNEGSNNEPDANTPTDVVERERRVQLKDVDQSPVVFEGTPTDWSNYPEVGSSLRQLIDAYERNDMETATPALAQYFGFNGFDHQDEMHGYIVAMYDAAGIPEKASIEVLRRDKRRPVWSYDLKVDMAICLRKYALRQGIEKTKGLVAQLRDKYGEKLPSLALAVIPRPLINQLQKGVHSQTLLEWGRYDNGLEEDSKQLLQQNTKDPFLDHLYYYHSQPEIALKYFPESILHDVLLFNIGYNQMRVIWRAEQMEEMRRQGFNPEEFSPSPMFGQMLKFTTLEGPLGEASQNAIRHFSEYIEKYPQRPHADDAAFWIAWLNAQMGRYDDCIHWIKKVGTLGNRDYEEVYTMTEKLEIEITPYLNEAQLRMLIEGVEADRSSYHNESVVVNLIEQLSYKEALRILEEPQYKDYKIPGLVHLTKKEFQAQHLDQAKEAAQILIGKDYHSKDKIKELINHIDEMKTLPEGDTRRYSRVVAGLKNYFGDIEGAFRFIDQSIAKLGNQKDLSGLLYLKIILMRDRNPYEVEDVVKEMIRLYPQSSLADDALAELIYVKSMVNEDMTSAEAYLAQLLEAYPQGNARDNGMNWVAMGYKRCCLSYCYGDIKRDVACERAKTYYKRIQREFTLTRFAGYAMQNLLELQ